MPGIAAVGTKLQGLGVTGNNAQGVALAGNVIFRSYVPVGTVLWSGNAYFESDANITLNKPISQLKTGIVINATNYHQVWWDFESVGDPNNPTKYNTTPPPALDQAIHQQIPFKTMTNGATFDVLVGPSYNKAYIRFTKVNDTAIKVGYSPLSTSVNHGYAGTTYYDTSAAYPYPGEVDSVIISSITAY